MNVKMNDNNNNKKKEKIYIFFFYLKVERLNKGIIILLFYFKLF